MTLDDRSALLIAPASITPEELADAAQHDPLLNRLLNNPQPALGLRLARERHAAALHSALAAELLAQTIREAAEQRAMHDYRLAHDPVYTAAWEYTQRREQDRADRILRQRLVEAGFPARLTRAAQLGLVAPVPQCVLRDLVDQPPASFPLLYLHGPAGCGLTHAAIAFAVGMLTEHRVPTAAWTTESALSARAYQEHANLLDAGLLVLDGLGEVTGVGPGLLDLLGRLLRHRNAAGSPTVVTSHLSPAQAAERYGPVIGAPLLDPDGVVIDFAAQSLTAVADHPACAA